MSVLKRTKNVETAEVKNVKPETVTTTTKTRKRKEIPAVSSILILPERLNKTEDKTEKLSFDERLEALGLRAEGLSFVPDTAPQAPNLADNPSYQDDLLDLIVEQDKRIDLLTRLLGKHRDDVDKVLDIQESLLDRLFAVESTVFK